MRSRETKAFLLETAAKLLFCKETLGEGPVVEDNCGVGAGIEASDGAEGAHLKVMTFTFFSAFSVAFSYFRSEILFRAVACEKRVGAKEWKVWRSGWEKGRSGMKDKVEG